MNSSGGVLLGTAGAICAFLLCAFFRMMQIGITRSTIALSRELGRKNPKRWKYARLIRAHAGRHIFVCHSGFFIGVLLLGLSLSQIVHGVLTITPVTYATKISFLLVLIPFVIVSGSIITLFLLQLCRAIAFNYPEQMLLKCGPSFVMTTKILAPLITVLESMAARILKVCGLEYPDEKQIAVPTDQLRDIVENSASSGSIEDEERDMIEGVFHLSDTLVREVMTPRADIISVAITAPLEDLLQLFVEEKLSRLLVIGDRLDDVRGIVYSKDLLQFVGSRAKRYDLAALLRPAVTVSGDKKVDEVLQEMREQANHFAVVLDEHDGVDGVVTFEDCIEEIVGDISDEFDSPADELEIRRTKTGDILIDASMGVEDFNKQFNTQLPRGEYDTIAGYIIHLLSRMPEQGEVVVCDRLRTRIERIEQNRITQLRIFKRRRPLKVAKGQSAESNALASESKNFESSTQINAKSEEARAELVDTGSRARTAGR